MLQLSGGARNQAEASHFLNGISEGLCGLNRYEQALSLAHEALSGNLGGFNGFLNECGPDDGPIPTPCGPSIPDIFPCQIEQNDCIRQLIDSISRFRERLTYTISEISDPNSCANTTITLEGSNFGNVAGKVCFATHNSSLARVCVDAQSWSDDEITVVVPADVAPGLINLEILEEVIFVCGSTLPIFRRGNGIHFDGGTVVITSLTVNGRHSSPLCIDPNSAVTIAWTSATNSSATVDITISNRSTNIIIENNLAASGSLSFTTPNTNSDQTLLITATATDVCGSYTRTLELIVTTSPVLNIEGMEVSQGIQTFWRSGVTWNSVPTIAGKDTIVRVYISCDRNGFNNDRLDNVTGLLHVDGTPHYPINDITPDNPGGGNPFISVGSRNQIDRSSTNDTLNFRIPASRASGTKDIKVTITGLDGCGTRVIVSQTLSWTWQTNTPLKVRFVRIRDNRSSTTSSTTPTDAQARFTIQRAFDLLPSPATDIAEAWASTLTTSREFTTDNGLRGLLDDIDDKHNCSAWEWLTEWLGSECPDDDYAEWVGLTVPFNRGWATGGNTCISAIHQIADGQGALVRVKTAHELGHNLGFCHVAQGCNSSLPGGTCNNHPNTGILQDIPFDPYWNQVVGTGINSVSDFMSYDCIRWVSSYSWNQMITTI